MRRLLYRQHVPPIQMELAYQHNTAGEIETVTNVETTPRAAYPANIYKKIYEIASIKVVIILE